MRYMPSIKRVKRWKLILCLPLLLSVSANAQALPNPPEHSGAANDPVYGGKPAPTIELPPPLPKPKPSSPKPPKGFKLPKIKGNLYGMAAEYLMNKALDGIGAMMDSAAAPLNRIDGGSSDLGGGGNDSPPDSPNLEYIFDGKRFNSFSQVKNYILTTYLHSIGMKRTRRSDGVYYVHTNFYLAGACYDTGYIGIGCFTLSVSNGDIDSAKYYPHDIYGYVSHYTGAIAVIGDVNTAQITGMPPQGPDATPPSPDYDPDTDTDTDTETSPKPNHEPNPDLVPDAVPAPVPVPVPDPAEKPTKPPDRKSVV